MTRPDNSPAGSPVRLTYILERFPADTLNFVYNEIDVMEDEGFQIDIHSLMPSVYCPSEARKFLSRTTAIKPVPLLSLLRSLLHYAIRRPFRLFSLLALFPLDCRPGLISKWPRSLSHVIHGVHFAYLVRNSRQHIHAHFAHKASTAAYCAAKLNDVTFSFTAHGSATIHPPSRYGLKSKAREALFIVAISEFNRRTILELCPDIPADRVVVNRTGIRLDDFPYRPHERDKDAPLRIAVVASLYPIKNHEGILEACGRLATKGIPFRLDLIGKDDDNRWPDLEKRAADLGIGDSVTFHGVEDHAALARRLAEADLLLLASHSEGIPVSMMEGMASGTPVLGPRVTGVPELVEEGVTGWLADPNDPGEFAAIMARLASEPELLGSVQLPARKKVEAEYDMVANARKLAGICRARLGRENQDPRARIS